MVYRVWRGRTNPENAEAYKTYLERVVLPELVQIAGFCGWSILRRSIKGGFEFQVQTRWDSLASISAFAGESLEVAVVSREAKTLLSSYDEHVTHFDQVLGSAP